MSAPVRSVERSSTAIISRRSPVDASREYSVAWMASSSLQAGITTVRCGPALFGRGGNDAGSMRLRSGSRGIPRRATTACQSQPSASAQLRKMKTSPTTLAPTIDLFSLTAPSMGHARRFPGCSPGSSRFPSAPAAKAVKGQQLLTESPKTERQFGLPPNYRAGLKHVVVLLLDRAQNLQATAAEKVQVKSQVGAHQVHQRKALLKQRAGVVHFVAHQRAKLRRGNAVNDGPVGDAETTHIFLREIDAVPAYVLADVLPGVGQLQ